MDLDAETTFLPDTLADPKCPDRRGRSHPWESYYGDLRKFVAHQLGGQQDADDVVQDIYRELLHSRCNEATNPRAYLWKIAWRVVHDAFQRQKRQRAHQVTLDPDALESLDSAQLHNPSALDRQLEAQDELLAALQGLPLPTQIAIVRSRRDGWSYQQIAAELGVTPHMVKCHIGRAIAHFIKHFQRTDSNEPAQGGHP